MRKVIYSKSVRKERPRTKPGEPFKPEIYYEMEEQGWATFHQFGIDFEEFEGGPGSFTTAIIELADGQVLNVPAENIRFGVNHDKKQ